MKKVGIIVFLFGLALIVFTLITSFPKDKVIQKEKIEISKDKPESSKWVSPITGLAIMGIGGILFWQTYNEQ
jgi:hypothetical protein